MNNLVYILPSDNQLLNYNGKPLNGGHVEVYIAGTTTKYITFNDFTGTTNPFKIPIPNDGRIIALGEDTNNYDYYVFDSFGNPVFSRKSVLSNIIGEDIKDYVDDKFNDEKNNREYADQNLRNDIEILKTNKQDKLVEGEGITIVNNVISSTGGLSKTYVDNQDNQIRSIAENNTRDIANFNSSLDTLTLRVQTDETNHNNDIQQIREETRVQTDVNTLPNDNVRAYSGKSIADYVSSAIGGNVGGWLGNLTVSQINALSNLKSGDYVTSTDSGTITLGNVDVVAGDEIYWKTSSNTWDKKQSTYLRSTDYAQTGKGGTIKSTSSNGKIEVNANGEASVYGWNTKANISDLENKLDKSGANANASTPINILANLEKNYDDVNDNTYVPSDRGASGAVAWYARPLYKFWPWISSKIQSVFGVTTTNIVTTDKNQDITGKKTFIGNDLDVKANNIDDVNVRTFKPSGTNNERINLSYNIDGSRGIWDSVLNGWVIRVDGSTNKVTLNGAEVVNVSGQQNITGKKTFTTQVYVKDASRSSSDMYVQHPNNNNAVTLSFENDGKRGLWDSQVNYWCYLDSSNKAHFKGDADTVNGYKINVGSFVTTANTINFV